MSGVFAYRHRVLPEEIDRLGHANNVVYVKWMQDAAVAHSESRGWPGSRYLDMGCGWVARRHTIDYLHPARQGWDIVVWTWVASMRKTTSVRRYRMCRDDGTPIAVAETRWAFIDYTTGRPMRIPPEVIQSFVLAGDDPPQAPWNRGSTSPLRQAPS